MWEIIGYCLLGILLLLLALLIVPMYARLTFYDELRLCVRVWGIPIFRYSSEEKVLPSDDKEEKPSKLRSTAKQLKTDGVGTTLHFINELARIAAGVARRLIAAITVDKLCLQLYITGSDAAETAENTGKVCAVLYPTVTALQQTALRIRKRAITVTPDFLAEEARATADITAHAIPLRIVMIASWLAFRYRVISKHNKEVFQHGKQSAESDGSVH